MVWQHTPYTVPLIITAAIAFVSALYVLQRRRAPSSQTGAFLLLASAVWVLGYALVLAGADLPTKLFWKKIQYVGITTFPAVWLAYTLQFTGRESHDLRMSALCTNPYLAGPLASCRDIHRHDACSCQQTHNQTCCQ